jgi:hypothetical protein
VSRRANATVESFSVKFRDFRGHLSPCFTRGPGGAGEISRWWSEARAQPPDGNGIATSALTGREKRPIARARPETPEPPRFSRPAGVLSWRCLQIRGFPSLRSGHPRLPSFVPPGHSLPLIPLSRLGDLDCLVLVCAFHFAFSHTLTSYSYSYLILLLKNRSPRNARSEYEYEYEVRVRV